MRSGDRVVVRDTPADSPEFDIGEVQRVLGGTAWVYWTLAKATYREDVRSLELYKPPGGN